MGLKILPSGRSFRVSTGVNNFKKKLSRATRFGELKNLSDNKESIVKALKPMERSIRLGKFGRLGRLEVMKKIKQLEGYNLTKQDKSDINKVLKHLSEDSRPQTVNINIKVVKAENPEDYKPSVLMRRHLAAKRFTDRESSQPAQATINNRPGSRSKPEDDDNLSWRSRVQKGQISRAAMNYDNMYKLGGGQAARNLQEKTYSKLQSSKEDSPPGDNVSGPSQFRKIL